MHIRRNKIEQLLEFIHLGIIFTENVTDKYKQYLKWCQFSIFAHQFEE